MFAISPTDLNWFYFLREKGYNSEINFWTPTPWNVKQLQHGNRLYFMLKSPIRKIGGFGEFVQYKNLDVNDAWNEFGLKNGCDSKEAFLKRLGFYTEKRSSVEFQKEIGCIILENSEFWSEGEYKDIKEYEIDFSDNIVKIKYFPIQDPFFELKFKETNTFNVLISEEKKKIRSFVTPRPGQSHFKAKVTRAYNNKCCISGDSTIELLEAAHIQQYINDESDHVQNGLLLRVDFHKLFDCGLLMIDENYEIKLSSKLKSEYYSQFNNHKIFLPFSQNEWPSREALLTKLKIFRE